MDSIHVHVWNYEVDMENPVEEYDATYRDSYDEYDQFGYDQNDGIYVEVRVPRNESEEIITIMALNVLIAQEADLLADGVYEEDDPDYARTKETIRRAEELLVKLTRGQ